MTDGLVSSAVAPSSLLLEIVGERGHTRVLVLPSLTSDESLDCSVLVFSLVKWG